MPNCLFCGEPFEKTAAHQKYCCRRCFRRAYYRRNRRNGKDYPLYKCSECGATTRLDFFPSKSFKKWERFRCPECNYSISPVNPNLKNPCKQCGRDELVFKKCGLCRYCYDANWYKKNRKKNRG